MNASTGASRSGASQLGQSGFQYPIESSPVVFNGYIYVGDDGGQLFEITNTAASSGPERRGRNDPGVPRVRGRRRARTRARAAARASGPWSILGYPDAVAFDVFNNHVYVAANDYVIEMSGLGSNWTTPTGFKHLQSGGTGPVYSSAVLDQANLIHLHGAQNSKLFKITYPVRR